MAETIKGIVQHLYNTASELAIQNVVLKAGEIGLESDTLRIKIGDGVSNWNDLGYSNSSDYIEISDDYSYEIKKSKSLVVIDCSGITSNKTLTITSESGCDIRNKVELINNNADYKLIITKSANTFWLSSKEAFKIYVDGGILKRSTGWGTVWEGSNQYILDTNLLDGKPLARDEYKGLTFGSSQYLTTGALIIGNNGVVNKSPRSTDNNSSYYDGANNRFDSASTTYPFIKLLKWYTGA